MDGEKGREEEQREGEAGQGLEGGRERGRKGEWVGGMNREGSE